MFDSKDKEFKIDESECADSKCTNSDMEVTEQHSDMYGGSHQDFFDGEKSKKVKVVEDSDKNVDNSETISRDNKKSSDNMNKKVQKSKKATKERGEKSQDDLSTQEIGKNEEDKSQNFKETSDFNKNGNVLRSNQKKSREEVRSVESQVKNTGDTIDNKDNLQDNTQEMLNPDQELINEDNEMQDNSIMQQGSEEESQEKEGDSEENQDLGLSPEDLVDVEDSASETEETSNDEENGTIEQFAPISCDDCNEDETVVETGDDMSEDGETVQMTSQLSELEEKFEDNEQGEVTEINENSKEISEESEEEVMDVDSFDDYGEAIQVFATVSPRFIPDDPRVPPEIKKASGTISQFGPTVGGVDLEFTSTASGIDQRYKFQGKAKAAFVLTGVVLDANVTISVLKDFTETSMQFKGSSGVAPTTLTNTLRNFLVRAANETIDDINGFKTDGNMEYGISAPIGIPNVTHRVNLIRALRKVFGANSGSNGKNPPQQPSAQALRFTFRDLDETTPKQVTLVYNGPAMFPTSIDYARNIIIEDSLVNNLPNKTRALGDNTKASNVNFDPTKIAINFDIKSKDVKQGLKTNTNYEFIALNKNFTFFKDFTQSVGTNIKFLEGFTLSNFKTGKKVPLLETSWVKDNTTMEASSLIALDSLTSSDKLLSSIDFNSISKNTFLDYDDLVSATAQSVALKIGGASIKFNTLKVYDTDSTITKIEVEDDRSNKYPVSLIPISESDKSLGANPQINGLQRSTPYNFKKLHVTAQPEDTSVIKTFVFSMFSSAQGGTNVTADPSHNILLRTSSFYEPSLFIESTPIFVSVADGTISTTATSSFTLQAFLPKVDVELPNRVKMPAVSNDKTSLRYVIEVDNSDGRAGELTVNGLKGDENYKVQKFVGKDRNFYIVNLYNLSENRDYGFLIFELSYKDLDGRELIARKVLSEINRVISVTTTSGGTKTIQFPDYDQDNTTGPEKTGLALFNVTLFEQTLVEARRAEIPVFIDDMNSRFLRLEFVKPESNPRVEVKLENGVLKFINLEPKTDVVYKLDFIWKDKDGQEKALSKYAKIVTPDVQVVDVKSTSITTDQSSATILFTLYSQPKLPIVSVSLSEEKMKYTWDKDKLELVITNLKPKTEYKDIEVTFKLENGLTAKHKLDAFMTKDEIVPPKGKVADFVAKVYRIALNREPEINGWRFWVSKLESKEITVSQFINDLMVQDEFINRFLSKEDFIKMMYQIVLGRDSEEEGQKYWMRKYDEYKVEEETLLKLRMRIASEMINEKEFKEYVTSMGLRY